MSVTSAVHNSAAARRLSNTFAALISPSTNISARRVVKASDGTCSCIDTERRFTALIRCRQKLMKKAIGTTRNTMTDVKIHSRSCEVCLVAWFGLNKLMRADLFW